MEGGQDLPPPVSAPGQPADHAARAAVLASYDVGRARDDAALSRAAAFLGRLCDAPVTMITVMDEVTQHVLAHTGLETDAFPVATSFCRHVLATDAAVEIGDTLADPRTADNPFVTGPPHVRFYAGVPLRTPAGVAIGTACVFDMNPRPDGLTALQRDGLALVADLAIGRLEDAAVANAREEERRRLADSEQRFHTLADTMPQMVWSTLPDGYHDYYNARWYEFTGAPVGSTDGEGWNGIFHDEDRERAWAVWRDSLATGEPYQIEYRLRHREGGYRWVLGRALPIRDGNGRIVRWFGTCTDIHEQKLAAEEREVIAQELSHRIKNIFAVISGLISFAARSRPELGGVAEDLRERIGALGRAHDFVRPHSRASQPPLRQDSLHGLLDALFAPYRRDGVALDIMGDDTTVDDRAATPLALLFHELATNAAKYGALSVVGGRVRVEVARTGTRVMLDWLETGGPPVKPATHEGFGSRLIEMTALRQLGGAVTRDWRPEGLAMRIDVPETSLSRA
jgi:PAS domain S-box-containing protein